MNSITYFRKKSVLISYTLLAVFSLNFILTSCSKDEPIKIQDKTLSYNEVELADLEKKLAEDPAYMNFLSDIVTIYSNMFKDCKTNEEVKSKIGVITKLTQNENLESNPEILEEFYKQIGFKDKASFLEFNNNLASSKEQLIKKYPDLLLLDNNAAERVLNNSLELKKTILYNQNLKSTSYTDCQYCAIDYLTCGGIGWVTAAMCVLGCSATGPLVIPCAIACTLLLIGGVSLECNGSLRECNQNYNCGFNLPF